MEKIKFLCILIAISCGLCCGDVYWRDWSADHVWGNPANWDASAVPTVSSGAVYVKAGSVVAPKGYPFVNAPAPAIYRLTVGSSGSGTASVTVESSGSLDVQFVLRLGEYSSVESNVHGKLVVRGGSVNIQSGGYIDVGSLNTDGTLTITGGAVNTPKINIPGSNYGTGIVYINGGSLSVGADGLRISADSVVGKSGKIDIGGGRLIIDGDARVLLKSYIAQGLIVGYDNNSTLTFDYNQTNPGKTTVIANSYNPFLARVPAPVNNKKEVPVDGTLSWRGGDWAQQHDVYVGTDPVAVAAATNIQPDINADGWIDIKDVLAVGANWLSQGAGLSGDINRSGKVDLADFILIAKDYNKPAPDIYKGRYDVCGYDYSGLDYNTTYYWRVDEVNNDMLWRGDVWSFTSKVYVDDQKDGWELTFSDEFNGDEMDWVVWASEAGYPTHILSSRWPENAVVENGMLRLLTKKESRSGAEWTTASIWTRAFKQKYGYWEASYRIGAASGLNNAFWMIKGGDFEIDIDEGHYPSKMNMNLHNWAGTHWATGSTYNTGLPLWQEFHKRSLEWTPTELIYYFDDVEVRRVNYSILDIYPDDEVEVRLSTAVLGWAGLITDALDGTSMDVDYLRVYQKRYYEVNPEMIINPASLIATASNTSQYGTRQPVYAINGAGLTGDNHGTAADGAMWMADTVTGWFKIDLGQTYSVDFLRVWNFNMAGYTNRGIKQADVYHSNSAADPGNPADNPANWTLVGAAGRIFTQASGRSDYGTNSGFAIPDIVDMVGSNARWVAFDIKTNHGGIPYKGISEIQIIKR